MTKFFALAKPCEPKRVAALCETLMVHDDGRVRFNCINGAWEGELSADRTKLTVQDGSNEALECIVVWEDDEILFGRDYNGWISWIEGML